MITYVDTSTLVKLLIDEAGTADAARIWDEADLLVIARIGHVEARAALAAARRQGRIEAAVERAAVAGLADLWSQVAVVELDGRLMEAAGDLAAKHGLRGYDAVHLGAARVIGADVFASADRRLCEAAQAEGFHVASPGLAGGEKPAALELIVASESSASATRDSGLLGVPVPALAAELADGGFRVLGSTIQELTATYREWMSTDGWIFDADYSRLDPYRFEEHRGLGYITMSIYAKPTHPVTTVAVIIGNFDGRTGNKRDLVVRLAHTPDDDLPARSTRLGSVEGGPTRTRGGASG
jgi:predicted nucleic acid-binding protein